MEEDEYRATYHEFNKTRCAFEKAILSRRAGCPHAHKFCLAEREGIACQSPLKQPQCDRFLETIREKALFALKITRPGDRLPHAKEIRIQLGSLEGLIEALDMEGEVSQENISRLVEAATDKYKTFQQLPFDRLIRNISQIQARQKKAGRKSP